MSPVLFASPAFFYVYLVPRSPLASCFFSLFLLEADSELRGRKRAGDSGREERRKEREEEKKKEKKKCLV